MVRLMNLMHIYNPVKHLQGSVFAKTVNSLSLRFYLKKNKVLRVCVKDNSCNSPEGLQLY